MKKEKQLAAQKLRKQGWAIPLISKELGVSKSSVSLWVRNIKLTEEQAIKMLTSPGKASATLRHERAKAAREEWFKQGYELAKTNENFRLLSALYWGEGWKLNNKNEFQIANCDPIMLEKILYLLKFFCTKQPIIRITAFVNNGLSLKQIALWWKRRLNLQIYPTIYQAYPSIASKKVVARSQKYGTVQIRVGSTELLQKVLGGISYLGEL